MTTMAALLGGVPMMLGTGSGAEIRQPLGYSIVGGLVVSQLLTLYTTPVVYLYLDGLSGLLSRLRQGGRSHREPNYSSQMGNDLLGRATCVDTPAPSYRASLSRPYNSSIAKITTP